MALTLTLLGLLRLLLLTKERAEVDDVEGGVDGAGDDEGGGGEDGGEAFGEVGGVAERVAGVAQAADELERV